MVPDLIGDLRRQIEALELLIRDLARQNEKLREVITKLKGNTR